MLPTTNKMIPIKTSPPSMKPINGSNNHSHHAFLYTRAKTMPRTGTPTIRRATPVATSPTCVEVSFLSLLPVSISPSYFAPAFCAVACAFIIAASAGMA